jgi:hypothetical protein
MASAPIPSPIPAAAAAPTPDAPFADYNPEGALGGMFAPAYIKGYAPSEQAVQAWTEQNQGIDRAMVDELRMPNEWRPPAPVGGLPSRDVYGAGRIPNSLRYGDDRGQVDPLALTASSQGGPYDVEARRSAIAQRVLENQQAQAAYVPTPKAWWMR